MSVAKAFGTLSALVLVTGLVVSPALAKKKNCAKLCSDAIKTCVAALPAPSTCTGTAKEKRACRKTIAKAKKSCRKNILKACRDRAATVAADVCSPSGAFVDPAYF